MYKQTRIDTFSVQLVCENGVRLCTAAKMSEEEIRAYWAAMQADRYTSTGPRELWIGGVVAETWG